MAPRSTKTGRRPTKSVLKYTNPPCRVTKSPRRATRSALPTPTYKPPSRIEILPLELRENIIRETRTFTGMQALALSCPSFLAAYRYHTRTKPHDFMYNTFKEDLYELDIERDAYRESSIYDISNKVWHIRRNQDGFQARIHRLYLNDVEAPPSWDAVFPHGNSKERVLAIFRMVHYFAERFIRRNRQGAIRAADTWTLKDSDYEFLKRMPDPEFVRATYQAFYRLQCLNHMYTTSLAAHGPLRFCYGDFPCFFDTQTRPDQIFVTLAFDFIGKLLCEKLDAHRTTWPTWAAIIPPDAWRTSPLNPHLHYFHHLELRKVHGFLSAPTTADSRTLLPRTPRTASLTFRRHLWSVLHTYRRQWQDAGLEVNPPEALSEDEEFWEVDEEEMEEGDLVAPQEVP